MKPYGYIYLVTDRTNGLVYVGVTTKTTEKRWSQHRSKARNLHKNNRFHNAIKAHGAENFSIEVIDEASSQDELESKEKSYIASYDSTNKAHGYNTSLGGDVSNMTEETRTKITLALTGKRLSESARQKMSDSHRARYRAMTNEQRKALNHKLSGEGNPTFGIERTPEWRSNISKAKQGTVTTSEHRAKLSVASKAKWANPEYKEKHRQERLDRYKDPAYREKQSQVQIDRYKDPEARKRTSEASKRVANDPEYKAKQRQRMNERYKDPEQRRLTGEASRKRWADPEYREKMSHIHKKRLSGGVSWPAR